MMQGCNTIASLLGERYLIPVLNQLSQDFPFVVRGFPSDNSYEYVNRKKVFEARDDFELNAIAYRTSDSDNKAADLPSGLVGFEKFVANPSIFRHLTG